MPLTVEEYKIGQLYMISKHMHEQSEKGEGAEIVTNEPHKDPVHGNGQFTEKRLHLNSKLPKWIQGYVPKIFYITEKAWNYYPYTITEYHCSFIPRFSILVKTCYKNDNGCSDNTLLLSEKDLEKLTIEHLDIAFDPLSDRYYKKEEDPKTFTSEKTGRGLLQEGWRMNTEPIMCSYKYVRVSFDVWGLSGSVETWVHNTIKEILIGAHRQAFAWIDQWHDMTLEDVRAYEEEIMKQTNIKVVGTNSKVLNEDLPAVNGCVEDDQNIGMEEEKI